MFHDYVSLLEGNAWKTRSFPIIVLVPSHGTFQGNFFEQRTAVQLPGGVWVKALSWILRIRSIWMQWVLLMIPLRNRKGLQPNNQHCANGE